MTGGAAGAMLCVAAGLAAGMAMRERWVARYQLLCQTQDLLARLRLMLLEERLGLCELLEECAKGMKGAMAERFCLAAQHLRRQPLQTLAEAYRAAEGKTHCSCEQSGERAALRQLFAELGGGTAAMREQAVASCLRRLKPAIEQAHKRSQAGGKLCVQLGLLAGLMAGIMLW